MTVRFSAGCGISSGRSQKRINRTDDVNPISDERPLLVEANPSSVIYLFGDSAKVRGGLVHLQAQDWIEGWKKPSDSVSWNVKLPRAYDYNIAMTYAASEHGTGSKFEIVAASSKLAGKVRQTTAWVGDSQDFEKIPLPGTLRLPVGQSTITLRLTGKAKYEEIMKVRTPISPHHGSPISRLSTT